MTGKLNVAAASYALDIAMGRAAGPGVRTVYLAQLTAAPTASSTPATMTEYAAAGYARVAIAMGVPAGTPRVTANTAALTQGPMTSGTGASCGWWAIVSSASGTTGDMLAQGDWAVAKNPGVGDSLTVAIGAVTVQLD